MAEQRTYTKDPDAVLDYTQDWGTGARPGPWLADGETIVDHAVTVTGATLERSAITDAGKSVTAWISGGTAGTQARVRYHVVTSAGREDDRTIVLIIAER